ncbi:S8 family serine peptidase [Streptomyces sp. ST1015]|uniref:S8 family serine peptidase n=1 Tax=unclassified Streptomyces TaxID=2593676 RepID=UPI00223C4634|nr:S8 family serine peptidase [Streptomyces sp. ST1015]
MIHTPHRRTVRIAVAAGLVAALSAAGPVPLAFAGDQHSTVAPADAAPKPTGDKLGSDDAAALTDAKAEGDKTVTMMVATTPGETAQVTKQLDGLDGGFVGRKDDALGYVRATVPTGKADAAIAAASKLTSVQAIDLRQEIALDDPTPSGSKEASQSGSYPAPGKKTPAVNPYNPSFETGAVSFVEDHPTYDGRGVTIGVLDSGVDLGHPALQKTTTGERKIVDWVTATDPVVDRDGTWLRMNSAVSGPEFTAAGRSWKAPAGSFRFQTFAESATNGGDMAGDLNRDGDKTDVWGVLYDAAAGTVRVDLDSDGDFTDETPLKPYKDGFQIGYFGVDDPKTAIAERIPFVVEIRKDVVFNGAGDKSDYVSIGVVESRHGTHVAGITAANSLFGGRMNGAAPGAKIVSSRACTWTGGCTNVALTEGMIDLVTKRGVDIVNMSIGGLPPLNDGNNARAQLYTRLIDQYGVQLVIAAGNEGPGTNTIGDPGLADKVISVGASISKETWASNYGSRVTKKYAMLPFSSAGPREDGGFVPTLVAPGAAVNTMQTWSPGAPVAEAGYQLPPGYAMLQGTSMASPQAAGASALLLSAAKQRKIALSPLTLRTALTSTAREIKGVPAHVQGSGLIRIVQAWDAIKKGATAHDYTVKAPVSTALSGSLKEPGFGTGIYDREGGLKAGEKRTYDVVVTRTSGPAKAVKHSVSLRTNDGTFKVLGGKTVSLPLNTPVTVKVQAQAKSAGVHSAIVELDDRATVGVDQRILSTVVVSKALAAPSYSFSKSATVQRNSSHSYFVTVPQGAKTLEVALGGLKDKSQTRFISLHPYGVLMEDGATVYCYNDYNNPDSPNNCRPDLRTYANPTPGVWEIEVESRRTSPYLDNPYTLDVSVLGTEFSPAVRTVPEARVGTPVAAEWAVTNNFAPLNAKLEGGSLGSAKLATPTIAHGASQTSTVVVPAGVERFDVSIGGVSDAAADLDLVVYRDGVEVGKSADGDSEESVSLVSPAAGTYTIVVDGYSVPAGTTTFQYKDVYFSSALGSVSVDSGAAVSIPSGGTATISGNVLVKAAGPEGREFFGEVRLVNARGTAAGVGTVVIEKVVG